MALPQESAKAIEERVSSGHHTSSSSPETAIMPPSCADAKDGSAAASTPPAVQLMDAGRIPAAVFERDPTEPNKDWSMMSTDSVFGLQVAPSSDFTGFFLAHPELMDISTPPRASKVDADVPVLVPHFESIPELPEASMKGNYSFAFPNLIEEKSHSSKKVQEEQPTAPAATPELAEEAPAPAEAKAEAQTSSTLEAAPEKEAAKGGLFSCFPCCS